MPPRAARPLRIRPVIISGGLGQRPDDDSVFAQVLQRVSDRELYEAPLIIASNQRNDWLQQILEQLSVCDATIILEPVGRNTAPAVLMASFFAQILGEETLQLVLHSDHHIKDVDAFHRCVLSGVDAAQHGYFVLFGMKPENAETGYSYINVLPGADGNALRQVMGFHEKPVRAEAQALIDSGAYLNSGMFLYHPRVLQGEVVALDREYYLACEAAWHAAKRINAQAPDQTISYTLPEHEYAALRSESIDVLVMAKTRNALMLPCAMGWNETRALVK